MLAIDIMQWREPYDDEDCLTVLIGEYSFDEAMAHLRDTSDIPEPTAETPDDGEGQIYITNTQTLNSGEIIESNGRKFKITIEEVPA